MSPKHPNKAIALLSGGLDSTVALAQALTKLEVVLVLTFDYGQRARHHEIESAKALSRHYQIPHEVVELPWLKKLLPEAMDSQTRTEDVAWQSDEMAQAQQVWVPNRNGVFLNIGAAYAEAYQAGAIVFGANAEEGETFPDNTDAFRQKLNELFEYATLSHPKVITPVGHLYKAQIIELALERDVPLNLIWSCYGDQDTQCGQCPSCIRLKAALNKVPTGAGYVSALFQH